MHRRLLLLAVPAVLPAFVPGAHAQEAAAHARPVYLEGAVVVIFWSEPRPHLEMLHRAEARVPALDVFSRSSARPAAAGLLADAVVPSTEQGRRWRIDLPPLAQLSEWGFPRPKVDQVIGVIGRPVAPVTGTPTLQPLVLFLDGKAYDLRSPPVSRAR